MLSCKPGAQGKPNAVRTPRATANDFSLKRDVLYPFQTATMLAGTLHIIQRFICAPHRFPARFILAEPNAAAKRYGGKIAVVLEAVVECVNGRMDIISEISLSFTGKNDTKLIPADTGDV